MSNLDLRDVENVLKCRPFHRQQFHKCKAAMDEGQELEYCIFTQVEEGVPPSKVQKTVKELNQEFDAHVVRIRDDEQREITDGVIMEIYLDMMCAWKSLRVSKENDAELMIS